MTFQVIPSNPSAVVIINGRSGQLGENVVGSADGEIEPRYVTDDQNTTDAPVNKRIIRRLPPQQTGTGTTAAPADTIFGFDRKTVLLVGGVAAAVWFLSHSGGTPTK
jgi:hypothetical protein